jgi:hypothetical protein
VNGSLLTRLANEIDNAGARDTQRSPIHINSTSRGTTMTDTIPAATQRRHRGIRSVIAGLLATTALLGAVACSGSDSSTGPRSNDNGDPAGTYALFQVDGKNIPKQIFRGPMTFPAAARSTISRSRSPAES